MGLALSVGILADLKENDAEGFAHYLAAFAEVNRVLGARGLPQHNEPQTVQRDFSCGMYGYSGLHYLRRVAAYLALGEALPAPGTRETYEAKGIIGRYYAAAEANAKLRFQHLMVHSDAEGFYLPLDFARPITEFGGKLPGGMLGSTPRLQAECRELAVAIGIPDGLDPDCDAVAEAIDQPSATAKAKVAAPGWNILPWRAKRAAPRWQDYGVETFTCLQLLAACDVSLDTGAAITFC